MKRQYLIIALKLALSIGLLIYIFSRLDTPSLMPLIADFHPLVWGVAICLIMMQLFLLSYRWHLLVNIGRDTMNFWQSLQLSLASFLANMIFLSGISGVGVRIAMALYYGASLFKSLIATILDRILSVGVLAFLAAVTFPSLSAIAPEMLPQSYAYGFALLIIVACVAALPVGLWILAKLSHFNITFFGGLNAVRYVASLSGDHRRLIAICLISFVAQLCFFVSVYIVAIDRIPDLPFWSFFTILPAMSFIASLPISIGGWGVREGAFVYGLSLIAVPHTTAFILSIEIGLLGMLATIVAGAPALWLSDRMLKNESVKDND